jgi:hypothetical protein
MKPLSLIATALLAAIPAFLAGNVWTAAAQECTGPFRQCAIEVQAQCSRDSDGRQRITYVDNLGNVMRFEGCVSRIFEANGQRSPYKQPIGSVNAGQQVDGGSLTVPLTELLYPGAEGRD